MDMDKEYKCGYRYDPYNISHIKCHTNPNMNYKYKVGMEGYEMN